MLKRLRMKIIIVVMGTLALVFAAVLLALNMTVSHTSARRTEDFMLEIAGNDGLFLPPRDEPPENFGGFTDIPAHFSDMGSRGRFPNDNMMRAGRFFYAKVDKSGDITELNVDMMFDFSADNANGYVTAALSSDGEKGSVDEFLYISVEKDYGRILVFAERSIEMGIIEDLTRISMWVAGIAGVILLGLSAFFAKWMVKPVRTALDKQRRFISDAGHELKTPLTIIGANADVLGSEIGDNQRLDFIKSQLGMMNRLVGDLLSLARMDESRQKPVHARFDLSGLTLNTALEFECQAFEEGKEYLYNIDEEINYIGDENQIKQLISILLDNAVKHSEINGKIEVSLKREGSRPRLSVYNTGIGIEGKERAKVFERFYRSDVSRSRETGGYGIGLSIAKMITDAHKAAISVSGEYGKWVRFDVTL